MDKKFLLAIVLSFAVIQLPGAASVARTSEVVQEAESILKEEEAVQDRHDEPSPEPNPGDLPQLPKSSRGEVGDQLTIGKAAFTIRGSAYRARGELKRAVQDYDQAVKLSPHDAELFFRRGVAHGMLGDADRAIDDFNQAIKLEPDHVRAL